METPTGTLIFSSGTLSKQEGTDLASVASGLSNDDLRFWLNRFLELPLFHETNIIEEEAARRFGGEWRFGPLFTIEAK